MSPARSGGHGIGRRQLLFGGAAAGLGAVAALGIERAVTRPDPQPAAEPVHGGETVPFHGAHQAFLTIAPQAVCALVALDLAASVDRDGVRRMLRLLTDDAARLTQGGAALADTEPELAARPARLTIGFGFGPGLVARVGGPAPAWLAPLPAFSIDRLEEAWSGGDLLLDVAADDPVTVAHAVRMLLKDARAFGTVRWRQDGFRRARGTEPAGMTMRNLFGQVDGTVNPQPGTADFDEVVWCAEGWLAGGTGFVLRRIRMDLDTWDELDRPARELSVGRRLATGAPLTGTREHDDPDLDAVDALGFPVIPEYAHIRRARGDGRERIYRRGYNYDVPSSGGSVSESGLLFGSYQADITAQFVPMQHRLAELDLLNTWTTPIGSAVFAIPPGCAPGGYIGDTLLEA